MFFDLAGSPVKGDAIEPSLCVWLAESVGTMVVDCPSCRNPFPTVAAIPLQNYIKIN